MAMSGDTLGLAIKAAIDAVDDKTDRDALFKAMGGAIVAHIQANASISGVATGLTSPPGGGPVTGTLIVGPGGID